MYNQEIKQAFIDVYAKTPLSKGFVKHLFGRIEPYEHFYGMDFAKLDVPSTQRIVNDISGIRSRVVDSTFITLKEYVRWCKNTGFETSSSINEIVADTADKMRSCMVSSPSHMKFVLDFLFPNPENNTIEYIYRSFLWLGYLGFVDHETILIKSKDVDFSTMRIKLEGCSDLYEIYPEAMIDLKQARDIVEFYEPRGNKGVLKQREDGDLLLRGKATGRTMEAYLSTTLRQAVSRAVTRARASINDEKNLLPGVVKRHISVEMSYKRAYLSGVFYRTYLQEQMGVPPRFDAIVTREMKGKEYKVGEFQSLVKIHNAYARAYLEDYKRWKAALID